MENAGLTSDPMVANALETIKNAGAIKAKPALVISADERTTESAVLRMIEQANAANEAVSVIIHPEEGAPVDRDRHWTLLLERATALHEDVRLALRLPPPTGMR
jgi:hypothetical protein